MALGLLLLTFLVGTIGFWLLSPNVQGGWEGWIRCAYMTVISLTTVGYTEVIPVHEHPTLMLFTSSLLLVGIAVVTYAFGAITAFLVEGSLTDVFWRKKMNKHIRRMDQHDIICGVGNTGKAAIDEMQKTGHSVILIDRDPALLAPDKACASTPGITGDATEESVLLEAGIERAVGLLTCLPSDRDNLFLIMTARQLNPSLRIVAKLCNPNNASKFYKAGASDVVSPQQIGGLRLASQLIRPTVVTFLDRM